MENVLFKKLGKKKRSGHDDLDNIVFNDGVKEIVLYGVNLQCILLRKRRFIIELHDYGFFGMVKFYPKMAKGNPKKFELRGIPQIGYRLSRKNVLDLIYQCALIMRDYLEENPEKFVGYVGQTDDLDSKRRKKTSQRSDVYNRITASIFNPEKYKLSSREKFREVNLKLIRKVISKQDGKLTKVQMKNYTKFLEYFESNAYYLFSLMTPLTREEVIKSLS